MDKGRRDLQKNMVSEQDKGEVEKIRRKHIMASPGSCSRDDRKNTLHLFAADRNRLESTGHCQVIAGTKSSTSKEHL